MGLRGVADLFRAGYDNGLTFWDAADQYGTHPHLREALKSIKATIGTFLPHERPGYTIDQVKDNWPGKRTPTKGKLLDALHEGAPTLWARDGTGKKGSPYRFWISSESG